MATDLADPKSAGLVRSLKVVALVLGIALVLRLILIVVGLRVFGFQRYAYTSTAQTVSTDDDRTTSTIAIDGDAATATSMVNPSEVRSLSIGWAAGTVSVFSVDDAETEGYVLVSEQKTGRNDPDMKLTTRGGTVTIDYGTRGFFFGCSPSRGKHLVVTLPKSVAENLDTLTIQGASGDYDLHDLTAASLRIELASGTLDAADVTADALSLDIASGSATAQGAFNSIELDLASGEAGVATSTLPTGGTTVDIASGRAYLSLPADEAGWTASIDKASGDFDTGFPAETSKGGERVTYGRGEAEIKAEIASGSLRIDPLS